jgi:hypothetical protein
MAFNQLGPTVLNDGGAIDCAAGEITQAELDNLVVSFDLALTVDFDSAYLYLGSESGPDALILRMQANGANLRLTLTERENFTDSAVFTNQDIAYTLGATASIRVTHEPDNTYTVFVNDVQAATGLHANDTTAGSVALHFGFGGSGTATYSNIQAITAVPVIEYVGGAAESGYSSTATITHGLTILEGDFVLAYINRNDVTPIGNVTTGQQWIKARDQQPDGETAWHAVYHTVAEDSFPAVLNFTLGAAADYQVIIKAFRPSAGKYIALGGVVLATNASKFTAFPMTASAGVVLPAKHASVIFGGKDRADNSTPSNTVDNGYTGVLGTGLGRASVAAHRLSNAPTTIAGNITVANTDNATADNAYSAHVTLVEVDRPQPKILGYELHTASADGSFAITVPDDATGIFVTVGGYSDGGASQLVDELSLANDNSLSFTQVIVEAWYGSQNGTTQNETLLLKSNDAGWSGTGAQTIYHSAKNGAYLEGHNFIVWYAKDFDLVNPIIDTDHSHGDAGVNPWDSSLTGMTASDMHVLPTYRYNGGFSLDINDQTEVVQVPAFNGAALTLAYKYGVDSMQVASSSTVKTALGLRGADQTAIIGNTDILGSAWGWTPSFNARSHFAAHTAGASEAIAEFHLYGSGSRAFNVFAFRADTGAHLGSGVVNISGSAGWHSVTGLNIALPAGVEVRIGFEEQGGGGAATLYRASSTGAYRQASSAVAPDPWVDDSVYNYDFSFYAVVGGADAVVEATPSKEFVWNLHAGTLAAITDKTINNANGATLGQTFAGLLDYNDGTDTGFDLTILKAVTPNSVNSNPVGDTELNQAIFEEGGYASDGTYPGVNTITIDCPAGVTSLDLELFHNTTYNAQTDLDVNANGVISEGHSVTGNITGTTILLEGVVPDGSNQVVINYTQNTSQYVYGNGLRVFNVVEGGGNTPVENDFSLGWNIESLTSVTGSTDISWQVNQNVIAEFLARWRVGDVSYIAVDDSFDGTGALGAHWENYNPSVVPSVERNAGLFRGDVLDNTSDSTIWFNTDQGRFDYQTVQFPVSDTPSEYIFFNVGIGPTTDPTLNQPTTGNPLNLAGLVVHDIDPDSPNYMFACVGHRGNQHSTLEYKSTTAGQSYVGNEGADFLGVGVTHADIAVELHNDGRCLFKYRAASSSDAWTYIGGGSGLTYAPRPNLGVAGDPVLIGLIGYAQGSTGVPFSYTADAFTATGGDILTAVSNSNSLSWSLVESVNSELSIEWSIFNAVANSLQIDWDALNTVLNNRLVRWNIFNEVLGGLQIDWEVLSSLTGVVSTLQTDWDLLQAVTNQAGLDWSILSTAQSGTQLRFNVLNQLSNNLNLDWSLLAAVNNTAQLNWSIEDQLGKVSQSASVSWGILTTINKQLSTHYDVLQAVGVSSQMRWDIAQAIQTEIQANWSILQGAENGVSLTWDSIALVDGGLQLAWTIQTETIRLPMHQMIIQGENRVMTILDPDRIMTIH